ncbi:MAG: magnesium transporter, partial [Sphaerobacteraceae bacterium]
MRDILEITEPIREHIHQRELEAAKNELANLHWADATRVIQELDPADRAIAFRLLDKNKAIDVFEELEVEEQESLLEALNDSEVVEIVEAMDPDDRTEFFDELPAKVAARLLGQLSPHTRDSVTRLLNYAEDSTGFAMNPNYVRVERDTSAADTLRAVRRSPLSEESIAVVFVTDRQRRYEGMIPLNRLVKAAPSATASELIQDEDLRVQATDHRAVAARLLRQRDLPSIPVVDSENRLLGAITFDDAMDMLEEEASELMYGLAGLAEDLQSTEMSRSERLTGGELIYPVRSRLFFLLVPLAGGFLVGGVIDQFEDVLAAIVATAIFIPVIMDTGGNVGTQSTTIFARGYALGHIDVGRFFRHIIREVRIGATLGLILGTLGGILAFFWQGAPNDIPELGIAVGVSLFIAATLASLLGFLLPWLLVKAGLDHAPGANPLITTIKDFTSLLVYFSLVAWL